MESSLTPSSEGIFYCQIKRPHLRSIFVYNTVTVSVIVPVTLKDTIVAAVGS